MRFFDMNIEFKTDIDRSTSAAIFEIGRERKLAERQRPLADEVQNLYFPERLSESTAILKAVSVKYQKQSLRERTFSDD